MTDLDVLQAVDFNWAMSLQNVWKDAEYDVPGVHAGLRQELLGVLEKLPATTATDNPLGWIIVGQGGSGKTHLLSWLRHESVKRKFAFVLVDMTGVHDFWDTVCLSYLKSIEQPCGDGQPQYRILLEQALGKLPWSEPIRSVVRKLAGRKTSDLVRDVNRVLGAMRETYGQGGILQNQNVIRALIALNSEDFQISNIGHTWLQGYSIEEEDRRQLGFTVASESPKNIVASLSWLMSLAGPTILAFDQLDAVVTQLHIATEGGDSDSTREEVAVAHSIIQRIGEGLGSIHHTLPRTFPVVSCIEATWGILAERFIDPVKDRFELPPRVLRALPTPEVARAIVQSRLSLTYKRIGFEPPYPTWPFSSEAFEGLTGVAPRSLLKLCDQHRKSCLHAGVITELPRFVGEAASDPPAKGSSIEITHIDEAFERLRKQAEPQWLLEEKKDDERLAPLLQASCRCILRESNLPDHIDAQVEAEFQGGSTTRPLHSRVRMIYHNESDREQHCCVRALQWNNAVAFQNRLRAAMTQSGIDRRLPFRHLAILRTDPVPSGRVTQELVEKFSAAGGEFVAPSEADLRSMWALKTLEEQNDPSFDDWLRVRTPASKLTFARIVLPNLLEQFPVELHDTEVATGRENGKEADVVESAAMNAKNTGTLNQKEQVDASGMTAVAGGGGNGETTQKTQSSAVQQILLGCRLIGDSMGDELTMPVQQLERHSVVFAGAGSGKTVLLKRLVEESALLGIPSIVIDCANDLATLGDPWPAPPDGWVPGDAEKSQQYFSETDVIIWTPGRENGNLLHLDPLPDFSSVSDDPDELNATVDMAAEGLREIVAAGTSNSAQQKFGVLRKGLSYFAEHGGGSLDLFIELLADLPPEAGLGIKNEAKYAREMADRIRVERETNVLLRKVGTSLDPAVLFGDTCPIRHPRVSVISFVGLSSLEVQRQFLNQLAMTLFSWIKKNPAPPDRTLRGLLILDEAKDFVPGQSASVCKASLMRLAAQARKYHLGVLMATQNPKEIDNKIVGNCSTQYYGKVNSPAAIDTLRDEIAKRGGSGNDIGTLPAGRFYVYNANAGMKAPTKVQVPMCLSHHPQNPLSEQEVLSRAVKSKECLKACQCDQDKVDG